MRDGFLSFFTIRRLADTCRSGICLLSRTVLAITSKKRSEPLGTRAEGTTKKKIDSVDGCFQTDLKLVFVTPQHIVVERVTYLRLRPVIMRDFTSKPVGRIPGLIDYVQTTILNQCTHGHAPRKAKGVRERQAAYAVVRHRHFFRHWVRFVQTIIVTSGLPRRHRQNTQ